ncbi:MAG: SDR family NAD(P)-dependent oxidoreductase [Hymenobacteraceae bacterium]|nr:SDR family NAD(P)-dependent oxidoreductase [Hymenobacteraceae bacterium]
MTTTPARTALITGATSGIGLATARELARLGFRLIVTGRRTERLADLIAELAPTTAIYPLTFDVRDNAAVVAAIAGLPPEWHRVDVLINNAGNAHGRAPIESGDVADWDAMVDSNVKGLLYVTRAVLPLMPDDAGALIINLGSIAGQQAYPEGAVYCASKAAVAMLTQGMRLDLVNRGIRVAEVAPGGVQTEFALVRFKGDEARAADVYAGWEPLLAEDVAEMIGFMATRPARVNLAQVVMLATAQASATTTRKTPAR